MPFVLLVLLAAEDVDVGEVGDVATVFLGGDLCLAIGDGSVSALLNPFDGDIDLFNVLAASFECRLLAFFASGAFTGFFAESFFSLLTISLCAIGDGKL